jgi:hypothetical protein
VKGHPTKEFDDSLLRGKKCRHFKKLEDEEE